MSQPPSSDRQYWNDRLEFQYAAAKIDPDTTTDDLAGPGRYDGASDRVFAWALETLYGTGAADETAGSVEEGRHLARFGRYVLETNEQGFVDVQPFGDEGDAEAHLWQCNADSDDAQEKAWATPAGLTVYLATETNVYHDCREAESMGVLGVYATQESAQYALDREYAAQIDEAFDDNSGLDDVDDVLATAFEYVDADVIDRTVLPMEVQA
jgi:hypothetical protein